MRSRHAWPLLAINAFAVLAMIAVGVGFGISLLITVAGMAP